MNGKKSYAVFVKAKLSFPVIELPIESSLGLGYIKEAYEKALVSSERDSENGSLNNFQGIYFDAIGSEVAAIEQYELAMLKGYNSSAVNNVAQLYWNRGDTTFWTTTRTREMLDLDPELLPLLPHIYNLKMATEQDKQQAIVRFKLIARQMGFEMEDLFAEGPHWGLRVSYDIAVLLGGAEAVANEFWAHKPMFWMWSSILQDFRQTDAFRNRVRSSGMLAYWQKHGWPDLCRGVGDDDFVCD